MQMAHPAGVRNGHVPTSDVRRAAPAEFGALTDLSELAQYWNYSSIGSSMREVIVNTYGVSCREEKSTVISFHGTRA